jgi:hypothetical protein
VGGCYEWSIQSRLGAVNIYLTITVKLSTTISALTKPFSDGMVEEEVDRDWGNRNQMRN